MAWSYSKDRENKLIRKGWNNLSKKQKQDFTRLALASNYTKYKKKYR